MSACSVCPFSNLSYARKLPPRVTAIFLLFLVFDLFFYLLLVPVIQNQLRIVLTRQSLGIFCNEEFSLCLCSLSKNRGEVILMNFFSASHSSYSQCSLLNKKEIISPCRLLFLFHLRKFEMKLAYRWVDKVEVLFRK